MALSAGTKPTTASSVLTDLALTVYNNKLSEGIYQTESAIEVIVGSDTFTEQESDRANRVLKAKLDAWSIAYSMVDYITSNAEVNNIPSIINDSLSSSVVVAQDGGASLKTTFGTALSSNTTKGSLS